MDITHAMRVLLQVVDSGSFAGAAEALGLSNPAVTRQIAALERHLGARLLNRTTRRLSLTDAGAEFCARARLILEQIGEAESLAAARVAQPTGLLRISAPLSFGVLRLSGILPAFRARYPDLRLDIDLSDRVVDLANEGIDVALRIASAIDGNLIARRIAPISLVVCAAPGYLRRHGTPRAPADLERHAVLSYRYLWSGDEWPFTDSAGKVTRVRVRPAVHATNGDLLCALAAAGGGIIMQPSFIVEDAIRRGRLVPILEEYRKMQMSLFAVYLTHQHLPIKVRVFIDYLLETMSGFSREPGPKRGVRAAVSE